MTEFVDLESAKRASGVRLVTVSGVPSPWSESAKGILRLLEIPFVAVRLEPGDKSVREWTRMRNAPVVMLEGEPARAGWAEILELAERIAPPTSKSIVPTSAAERVRMFGLSHEVLGEGGLVWSARQLTIAKGLETDGARGFPTMVATYLGKRYGHASERAAAAEVRVSEGWTLLAEALGNREYFFFDDRPSALDVYAAAAVNLFALPSEDQCRMWPPIRAAFESMRGAMAEPPASLLALRERMYARHLELPIVT
jgi:glutathione S-transferase